MNRTITHCRAEYVARRMSRREFAGRLAAAGLSAVTFSCVLSASDAARAAIPVKGGRLRIGWHAHSVNDTLNPNHLTSSLDYLRAYQICSQIVRLSSSVEIEPDLANEWIASPDLQTWRFRIRRGVEFHDGRTLTPRDCVYSLNRHRGESSDSRIRWLMNTIAELKVDGEWLVVELEAPDADFPVYLGAYHAVVVPDGFEDFDHLVGTGPFILDSFVPGAGMLAKRNPNYHHEGYPHVDEVESFGMDDAETRTGALLDGDIHFMTRVGSRSIRVIEGAPSAAMVTTPSNRHLTFPMVSNRAPTDNRDFRQAMRLLLDRKDVLSDVQDGQGMIGNDLPIAPIDRYFCSEIPQRDIDLDKAKFHLKKAGMDGGSIDLRTCEAAGGTQSIEIALMMKANASRIGFDINVIREPVETYWSKVWMNPELPIIGSHWSSSVTAHMRFALSYTSGAKWNEAFWHHPKFDDLVARARSTPDGPQRREIYCDAQRIMWREGGSIIPLFTHWLDARSTRLGGHRGHPVGEADDHRIHEWGFLTA